MPIVRCVLINRRQNYQTCKDIQYLDEETSPQMMQFCYYFWEIVCFSFSIRPFLSSFCLVVQVRNEVSGILEMMKEYMDRVAGSSTYQHLLQSFSQVFWQLFVFED